MFTPSIYSDWMKKVQNKKYEGILIDFLLPLHRKLDFNKMKFLDVGIGKGWFEKRLLNRGIKPIMIGIDMEKDYSKIDKVKTIIGDGSTLPFKNEYFDFIISLDTLHLIRNTSEIFRVLKKDGYALISIFCNEYNAKDKRDNFLARIGDVKILKEGIVGDPDEELSYVFLLKK